MALIIPGSSKCSICGEVLAEGDELCATTAFLPADHPLWRHSDAAMHRTCFLDWSERPEFIAAFNEVHVNHPEPRVMAADGSIETRVNPEYRAAQSVLLAAWDRQRERSNEVETRESYAGRSRRCPECAGEFVSVQDKGVCPTCGHVFAASAYELIEGLDDVSWERLTHAKGSAKEVSVQIRAVVLGNPESQRRAIDGLLSTLCDQGVVYDATAQALPFLVRILARDSLNGDLVHLVARILSCVQGPQHVLAELHEIGAACVSMLTPFLAPWHDTHVRIAVAEALACFPEMRDDLQPLLEATCVVEQSESEEAVFAACARRIAGD